MGQIELNSIFFLPILWTREFEND